MKRFRVTIAKEFWESTEVEIDADNEGAAEEAAIKQAMKAENIEWKYEETNSIEAIRIEEMSANDNAKV